MPDFKTVKFLLLLLSLSSRLPSSHTRAFSLSIAIMLARQGLSRPQLLSRAPTWSTRPQAAAAARTRCVGAFASSSSSSPTSKSPVRRPAAQQQPQVPSSATSEYSSKELFAATAFPTSVAAAALAWLAAAPAAFADDDAVVAAAASAATDFSKGGFAKESYYVTLGLFLLSLPGQLLLFLFTLSVIVNRKMGSSERQREKLLLDFNLG